MKLEKKIQLYQWQQKRDSGQTTSLRMRKLFWRQKSPDFVEQCKKCVKKDCCRSQKERLTTGEGPANKDSEQLDEFLTGIMENQPPTTFREHIRRWPSRQFRRGITHTWSEHIKPWFSLSLISDYCLSPTALPCVHLIIWTVLVCRWNSNGQNGRVRRQFTLHTLRSYDVCQHCSQEQKTHNEKLATEFHEAEVSKGRAWNEN